MYPSCNHMFGPGTGTPGSTPTANGFGLLGTGLGPLEVLGLFLLASLVLGLLLWLLKQPGREDTAISYAQWDPWPGEPRPEFSRQVWSFPAANAPAPREQTQVDYPELPYDQPLKEQPPEQYPE
jgi:hypothetical protein